MPWGRILSSHGILIVRPLWVYLPALKWHQVPSSGHETKRHPGDRWDGGGNFLRAVSGDTLNTPNICLKVNWWDLISKWCLMLVIPEIKLSIHGVHVYIFNECECVISLVIILFLDWWIYMDSPVFTHKEAYWSWVHFACSILFTQRGTFLRDGAFPRYLET